MGHGHARRQLLEMLGLDPLPKRTPLNAQITGWLDRDAYRIGKLVFQSLPGLYVTGNSYVPKGPAKPLPAILYLCGHSPHPLGAKFQYQDRAIWFASHGYVCLISEDEGHFLASQFVPSFSLLDFRLYKK